MKNLRVWVCASIIAAGFPSEEAVAQPPARTAAPAPADQSGAQPTDPRLRREQALVKLFEGQRHMWKLQRMQTQAGRGNSRRLAKEAFEAALALDATLADAHVALSQLAVAVQPRDMDEGIRQAELAIKANPDNAAGHRMAARLYTVKSRLSGGPLDTAFAEKAEAGWREVARLEQRNAEAWAFLSIFAEARGRNSEQIEALRKWVSASTPSDVAFFEGTVNGASLSPEYASYTLAAALERRGNTAEAAEILAELIADNRDNSDASALLSEIAESADGEAAKAALAAIEKVAAGGRENTALTEMIARLQARTGRYENALTLLKGRILALGKTDPAAAAALSVSLSELYLQSDRFEESAAALDTAVAMHGPASRSTTEGGNREFAQYVFERLIHVWKLADRPQAVLATIEKARGTFGKDDTFADRQLLEFLQSRGSRQEALTLVRNLRAGRPTDTRLLRTEASILVDLGQVDAGVDLIRKRPVARTTTPENSADGGTVTIPVPAADEFSDLLFVTNLYLRAGRHKEALATAGQALNSAAGAERRQIAKMAIATALHESGEQSAAEAALREVLRESPGNPMALNNLGYFLTERGEKLDEAVEMIKRAVKLDPRNASYVDSLGWAYFKLGKLAEAERYLTSAARLAVDSATITEHLGDMHREKGNLAKARSFWTRALRLSAEPAQTTRLKQKLAK